MGVGALASGPSDTRRARLELAGDGLLITAAVFAVLTAVGLTLLKVLPEQATSDNIWLSLAGAVMGLGGGIVGPVVVWRLYWRKVDMPAVFGAVIGMFLSGPVFMIAPLLSVPLGWILSPFTRSEFAGPLAVLVLVSAAFLAALVWLIVDAVRDHAPAKRAHRSIDVARLVAGLTLVAFATGVTVLALRPGEGETFEALIFMFVAGIGGALAVTGADIAQRMVERGRSATPTDVPA